MYKVRLIPQNNISVTQFFFNFISIFFDFFSAIMQHIWPFSYPLFLQACPHILTAWPSAFWFHCFVKQHVFFFLCTAVNYNVSIHPEVDMFILQLNFHICSSYVSWHNRRIFAVKRTLYWAFYLPLVKTHDFTVMNINDVYMFSVIRQWPGTVHV